MPSAGPAGGRSSTYRPTPATGREGSTFYHFDKLYDARNVGYRGPKFSYASMPDQYTLSALQRLELAKNDRGPVMAEIDLVSSHHPWTPLPHMVDWRQVGDGSVYDGMPDEGESPEAVFGDPDKVRAAYGKSIEYSMRSLVSFVQTYGDPNLVLVVLGDHQPHSYVTGDGRGPRRADHGHRARPAACSTGSPGGAGRRASGLGPTRRSGGWTASATASSRPTAHDRRDRGPA